MNIIEKVEMTLSWIKDNDLACKHLEIVIKELKEKVVYTIDGAGSYDTLQKACDEAELLFVKDCYQGEESGFDGLSRKKFEAIRKYNIVIEDDVDLTQKEEDFIENERQKALETIFEQNNINKYKL